MTFSRRHWGIVVRKNYCGNNVRGVTMGQAYSYNLKDEKNEMSELPLASSAKAQRIKNYEKNPQFLMRRQILQNMIYEYDIVISQNKKF